MGTQSNTQDSEEPGWYSDDIEADEQTDNYPNLRFGTLHGGSVLTFEVVEEPEVRDAPDFYDDDEQLVVIAEVKEVDGNVGNSYNEPVESGDTIEIGVTQNSIWSALEDVSRSDGDELAGKTVELTADGFSRDKRYTVEVSE